MTPLSNIGRTHFLVYSDATDPYAANAAAFCAAALAAGFDTATHYTRDMLERTPFWDRNRKVLSAAPRAGHGAWKPYILLETLRGVGPDDVVVCHDAGGHAPGRGGQMPHFPAQAIRLAAAAPMRFIHGSAAPWTPQEHHIRRDCLIGMGADDAASRRAPFVSASPLIYLPSDAAFAFLADWLAACCDPGLVADGPDRNGATLDLMRSHQAEEAVGSLLVHRHGAAYFDLSIAAPALFDAACHRRRHLRDPHAHLATITWVLDQLGCDTLPGPIANGDGPAPPRQVPPHIPPPVLRRELLSLAQTGDGRICRDHVRAVIGDNRVVRARLHGLKNAPDIADEFWAFVVQHVNGRVADLRRQGVTPALPDLQAVILQAVRATLADLPQLDDDLLAGLVWGRLGDRGREAFKNARAPFRSPAGAEAMAQFLALVRDRDIPSFDLEVQGDLDRLDGELARALMDWLLLDHL